MIDKLIQLTDYATQEPMFVDVTRIISIEPINLSFNGIGGSHIQVMMPEKHWLYKCREFPETINKIRLKKIAEINKDLDNSEKLDRFEILDL